MLIGWRGGETDRSQPRIGGVGRGGVAERARGSAREQAADLPASYPGRRASAASRDRVAERGAGGPLPSSTPGKTLASSTLIPSLPSPALLPGVLGGERREGTKEEEAKAERGAEGVPARGEARAASRSPAASAVSLPGAAAPGPAGLPGCPHYAGGLPAAAMASRGVVRTGRSPHRCRVRAAAAAPARAALPHSHSCLLPPRSNSSSSPMSVFLLLLFILLLLEDARAQQGEWSPGIARRVEPHGWRGRGESPQGARFPGHWPNRRRSQ